MATDEEINEIAFRAVAAELDRLAQFDRTDVNNQLSSGSEIRYAYAMIRNAVDDLRDRLEVFASDHGVDLRTDA